jgi:hypothetical protein
MQEDVIIITFVCQVSWMAEEEVLAYASTRVRLTVEEAELAYLGLQILGHTT